MCKVSINFQYGAVSSTNSMFAIKVYWMNAV